MDKKLIKDPVHGYIRVPKKYFPKIIDTPEFQRLRNIRQTSYDSLYPGSSHNRFIHSLGVYHLGCKAFDAFQKNSNNVVELDDDKWNKIRFSFEMACLLHDVGHTPFSHSGEKFLLIAHDEDVFQIMNKNNKKLSDDFPISKLYNDLLRIMNQHLSDDEFEDFKEDFAYTIRGSYNYNGTQKVPKEHEIMSVIVAIDNYIDYFISNNVDIAFFARAILGIEFIKKKSNSYYGTCNAVIGLLNSKIIDVDRIDYMLRDTQMSGFDNTSIDIERLLESVTLCKKEDGEYCLAYKKTALSTLENAVLANDAEIRWIQSHPVIIYDTFLVEKCLKAINNKYNINGESDGIFQQKSMSEEGIEINDSLKIRLLNDGDCLFLMKQLTNKNDLEYVDEYLARSRRKQPIWKSEAEFNIILDYLTSEQQKRFLKIFAAENEQRQSSIGEKLNNDRIDELKNEIELIKKDTGCISDEDKENSILNIEKQLFWLEGLKDYFEINNNMDFDIHNQICEPFKSKINNLKDQDIQIQFDNFGRSKSLSEIFDGYRTIDDDKNKNKLIYWYIKKNTDLDLKTFAEHIRNLASEFDKKFRL